MNRADSRKRQVAARRILMTAAASVAATLCGRAMATITLDTHSNSTSSWTISNGALTVDYNPGASHVDSVIIAGHADNILDPAKSLFDSEFAGTPFGGGPQTYNHVQTSNYIDFWTTNASTGTSANPVTYEFHYLMFNNDPAVHTYEVVSHSATDPAAGIGQGQFLLRVDPAKFNNLYQYNTSPNNPGAMTTQLPNSTALLAQLNGTGGYGDSTTVINPNNNTTTTFNPRLDLKEVLDLNGNPNLEAQLGRNFLNKYDYSSYEQFRQGQTEVGPNYAVSSTFANHDTFTGGPTKQNLQFTNNLLMSEFLSGHYGTGSVNPGDPGYSYTFTQGVNTTKLFGPYIFRITNVNGETPAQLYNDAINSAPTYPVQYQQDTALLAAGYVPYASRGSLQANIGSSVGWSANTNNNTVVLSDNAVNFQESHQGGQYWAQLDTNGQATINNIQPGSYRMSVYQYGQWGETRVDGVQVVGGKLSVPNNVVFTPENFSNNAPIWTIGTPDRSSHEFLNGHFVSGPYAGQDNRNYYGSYNYWQEMQNLGNNGKVVYYGTQVGATPATNDPNKWIGNQWQSFDPSLYNPSNNLNANSTAGTVGLYPSIAPAYVGNPATYTGSPWEVHFATTSAQATGKNYVVLSAGLAGVEGSLIVTLNGNTETWHYTNNSDPMIRSGLAGYYQWVAFEWPIADLLAPGGDNIMTFSVSQTDGVMYDALRMELAANSANPSVTGWKDYFYVNSNGSSNAAQADDSKGLVAQNQQLTEPEVWIQNGGGSWTVASNWANFNTPDGVGAIANFGAASSGPFAVTLDANHTLGTIVFNSSNTYTISSGASTTNSLILDAGGGTALINDLNGNHTISAPVVLNSTTSVVVANSSNTMTFSGAISGAGGISQSGLGTVVLAASNSYGGGTTITSGTMILAGAGALPTGSNIANNGNLVVNAANSVHQISGAGTLAIGAAGSFTLSGGAPSTQSALSITTGGRLVMNNTQNTFILQYGSNASPNLSIRNYLQNGYNNGHWDAGGAPPHAGVGAITSIAAGVSGNVFSVGYADGADGAAVNPLNTLQLLPAGQEELKYTYAGDANLDGQVNLSDLIILSNHFGSTGAQWDQGDYSYDGSVNLTDLIILSNNFGDGVGSPAESALVHSQFQQDLAQQEAANAAFAQAVSAAVPEPAGIAIVSIAALGIRRRKRPRQR